MFYYNRNLRNTGFFPKQFFGHYLARLFFLEDIQRTGKKLKHAYPKHQSSILQYTLTMLPCHHARFFLLSIDCKLDKIINMQCAVKRQPISGLLLINLRCLKICKNSFLVNEPHHDCEYLLPENRLYPTRD